MMLPGNRQIVSPEQFNQLFRSQAHIAEFATKSEEDSYERRDSTLNDIIRAEAAQRFGSDPERGPFIGDDWWPDHTRHLEVTPEHCTPEFFEALIGMLSDEYVDYRIQLCVYGDHKNGKSYVGSMALYADRVLIEEALCDLLDPA